MTGGETGCSGAMVGALEDQSRDEPEQAGARAAVDNRAAVLLGTEADNLRSMLVHAASLFSCRDVLVVMVRGRCNNLAVYS